MSTDFILQVERVSKSFGGLVAIGDVSLNIARGSIHAVIGPNGAGKSTLFNIISGVSPANEGRIRFQGDYIESAPAHKRVEAGMARTFQNLQVFPDLSVLENVMVGRHTTTQSTFFDSLFNTRRNRTENQDGQDIAYGLLKQVGLHEQAMQQAGALSYGQAKLMEIARAMASEPRLVLLDEPIAGLPASAIELAEQAILQLNERGVSVLLVEHNVRVVMRLSHHVSVLNNGRLISEGSPEHVRHDPLVLDAYLGEGAHA